MRLYDMFDQNNTMNGQQAQDSALAFDGEHWALPFKFLTLPFCPDARRLSFPHKLHERFTVKSYVHQCRNSKVRGTFFLKRSVILPLYSTTMSLQQLLLELDRLIRTSGISTCALLPPNHDICLLMRQIPLLITQSPTPLQTMLTFVEKVVYMLYKSNTNFALEAYTGFLQSLFEMSVDVAKEALLWIVYSEDEVSATALKL